MPRYPQIKENVSVARRDITPALREAIEEYNAKLDGNGRILVRPSGTEPVIRVLAEASDEGAAKDLCASIAALVQRELG
jgi:phosphoglucosamine mutase